MAENRLQEVPGGRSCEWEGEGERMMNLAVAVPITIGIGATITIFAGVGIGIIIGMYIVSRFLVWAIMGDVPHDG